jgi:hypothetical protein
MASSTTQVIRNKEFDMCHPPYHHSIRTDLGLISFGRLCCTDERPISINLGRHSTAWITRAETVEAIEALAEAAGLRVQISTYAAPEIKERKPSSRQRAAAPSILSLMEPTA